MSDIPFRSNVERVVRTVSGQPFYSEQGPTKRSQTPRKEEVNVVGSSMRKVRRSGMT